ncbi:unnamed protein product [Phytophthora fragariaefolia]|uniref:Unnamed protein product n=1 Tax=Phytophthora fragariaefolia TaxID=1490495 RepID=A0A9W7DBK6_9STRA|nr:unnamed protein product [Phytophthora fragariaefolia]
MVNEVWVGHRKGVVSVFDLDAEMDRSTCKSVSPKNHSYQDASRRASLRLQRDADHAAADSGRQQHASDAFSTPATESLAASAPAVSVAAGESARYRVQGVQQNLCGDGRQACSGEGGAVEKAGCAAAGGEEQGPDGGGVDAAEAANYDQSEKCHADSLPEQDVARSNAVLRDNAAKIGFQLEEAQKDNGPFYEKKGLDEDNRKQDELGNSQEQANKAQEERKKIDNYKDKCH